MHTTSSPGPTHLTGSIPNPSPLPSHRCAIIACDQSDAAITVALPNVGQTGQSAFLDVTQHYADLGVGLSTFGVGFNFGQELVLQLSQIRGGNYFFLEDAERIHQVFAEEFEYLVTPIAFDMEMAVKPGIAFRSRDVYGIHSWTPGDEDVELFIPTLFLSRNRGAILFQLENSMVATR